MDKITKLANLKTLLGINDTSEDTTLNVYLDMAESEIMNWLYSTVGDVPEGATLPQKYDWVQIQACIAGFNLRGVENQVWHSENNIARTFKYPDMIVYIHNNVYPYVGLPV